MLQTMSAQDEFICGQCGATSLWGDRYYQNHTPNTPFPPLYSFWDWEKVEHHRAFCPKCGALVADRHKEGFGWANGARPGLPDKVPTAEGEGGHGIIFVNAYMKYLVPHGDSTLDIKGYEHAVAEQGAKYRALLAMSVPDLIGRLRESKGTSAPQIEQELASRGEAAVPYLIEALGDPEVYLRWRTCYVLKRMGDKALKARPALEKARQDSEEGVRRGSEDALNHIGKPEPPKPAKPPSPWWKFW